MINGNSGYKGDAENTRQVADGPTCRACTRLDSLADSYCSCVARLQYHCEAVEDASWASTSRRNSVA